MRRRDNSFVAQAHTAVAAYGSAVCTNTNIVHTVLRVFPSV